MNTASRRPDPAVIEREWQLQERALHEERLGLPGRGENARLSRYRQLSRALRQPLDEALPENFADQVMRRIETAAAEASERDRRFERGLVAALVAVFGLAIGAMIAIIGLDWLQPLASIAKPLASQWLLALLACVAVSQAFGGWRGHTR